MGWTRTPRRAAARAHHRPGLEALEVRSLLSAVSSAVKPLAPGPVLPADGSANGSTTYYDALIGASAARAQYHVDGTGMTVAVIDAGVDYKNEALGGGLGSGHKVVAGYDFADNSADPMATGLQHGTSVAGLIASDDPAYPGVAPGADVVALRVFDQSNNGDFSKVADALQWVVDNHDKYNITAVNISISDGRNYAQNWFASDGGVGQRITDLITKLDALNIPVMTATGNSFNGQQGAGFPGIIADSISVTSTNASDQLVSNAQRLGAAIGGSYATDIAAPGDGLTAPTGDSGFTSVGGTSFATPLVTGAVVLMQQVYEQRFGKLPTVQDVDNWLQQCADPVKDSSTGITIGRLDIPKTIAAIPNPAAQVLTPPTSTTPPSAPSSTTPPPTTPSGGSAGQSQTPTTPPADQNPGGSGSGSVPPTGTTPVTPPIQLWVNGQQVTGSDLQSPNSRLSNMPAALLNALKSLKNWWTSPNETGSRVRVWTAPAQPGTSQPAGVVKKVALAARPHPAARAHAMPRAWHTFAARKRTG
jgi:type VI secretion system secreted protein VgrG